jgi:hypothetical protein
MNDEYIGSGQPRGYAFVEMAIRSHDKKLMGHMINVEYVQKSTLIELSLGGYGRTIQKIKKQGHLGKIFSFDVGSFNLTDNDDDKKGAQLNTNSQFRSGTKPYIANAAHNILQQQFYNHLCEIHGKKKVKLEKDYIDIRLTTDAGITVFEIKPYHSPAFPL